MSHPSLDARAPEALPRSAPNGQRCDFCGARVSQVRRVALDQDYDRLQVPHQERYACTPCSDRKERRRRGL